MEKFKVGMRVKYKPKAHIQALPEVYRSLGVAYDAIKDYDIPDFTIANVSGRCYVNGDERSRIVHIKSEKHRKSYNTLAIFLTPCITTINEGDVL